MNRTHIYLRFATVVVTGQLFRDSVSDRVPRFNCASLLHLFTFSELDNQQQSEPLNTSVNIKNDRMTKNIKQRILFCSYSRVDLCLRIPCKKKSNKMTNTVNNGILQIN